MTIEHETVEPEEVDEDSFLNRLTKIRADIKLAEHFSVVLGYDSREVSGREAYRYYYQIGCWRKDVVTGEMGMGFGGKAYLSPKSTDSELVQTVFGLYKGYVEHEARETFEWRGRRVFGPHMDIAAVWTIADQTDASWP